MDNTTKSILQMARGAITERADYEMARIIGNIMDAEHGVQAVECLPQVPGQFDMDGGEAEAPATLKIVNFA